VPVFARTIEAAGIPTVTVTMTPILSDKYRSSRTLGVQFPFGHSFGAVADPEMQRRTLNAALQLLVDAPGPETRVDVDEQWPGDAREANKNWQPDEPGLIVLHSMEIIRQARAGTKPQS
jgi:hypothetical protein